MHYPRNDEANRRATCNLPEGVAWHEGISCERLRQCLQARLSEPLPGPMVGSKYEPFPTLGRHYGAAPENARRAAVLILLYPHAGRWWIPLTVRSATLPDHPGQISLPGGAIEQEESPETAAEREYREELGEFAKAVHVGRLSPIYVDASNFRVFPCVAVTDERPALIPNPAEVAEVLEVPVGHLIDERSLSYHRRKYKGREYRAPHFQWHDHRIWGATCMILGELVSVLRDMQP
ncbi:MAG: CoA pyrophosphatase [Planctomycetota bacterium]|nr:MAG: CoA pyrophosphatase [Planctomycetota bacterium]